MASYTTNLNLKKPAGSENVSIGDINNNMDLIDQAYGNLSSAITDFVPSKLFSLNNAANYEIGFQNGTRHLIVITATGVQNRGLVLLVSTASDGSLDVGQVFKGNNITYTTANNKITVTPGGSVTNKIADFSFSGDFVTITNI